MLTIAPTKEAVPFRVIDRTIKRLYQAELGFFSFSWGIKPYFPSLTSVKARRTLNKCNVLNIKVISNIAWIIQRVLPPRRSICMQLDLSLSSLRRWGLVFKNILLFFWALLSTASHVASWGAQKYLLFWGWWFVCCCCLLLPLRRAWSVWCTPRPGAGTAPLRWCWSPWLWADCVGSACTKPTERL